MGDEQATERSMVPLKDVLRRVETGWSPVCEPRLPAADEWGVLKLSAVTSGRFVAAEAKALPKGVAPRPGLAVRPRDVLVSRANGVKALVGIVCQVGDVRPGLMVPDLVFRLVPDPEVLDPRYLAIVLASAGARRQIDEVMRGSSGQYKISQADVRTLRVPRLALDEQRRIVAAHAAFERRIGALEGLLGKLRSARTGLVNALVAGPATPVGTVLAGKPKNGYSPSGVPEWTGLQALGLGCLTNEGFVPAQLKRIPNTPLGRRYLLQDGDLLMSRANTRELVGLAGRYRDVGSPCIYPDLMMRLRLDETRCLTSYLELALSTGAVRSAVRAAARGTSESMVKISAATVEALRVPLPDVAKQSEIVSAVAAMDQRIARQAEVVAKLRVTQRAVVEDLLVDRAEAPAT
ncbi:hypothetical protein OG250_12155 [Streptomyces sp. NBC_00487]|uniref:hypothetical protein n=1 Tax=unclassified Streptomyces TaxID=2593676 RepID=UPI002E19F4E5|nr:MULTISPECIES: hypothetical protein [unclassified Streptomyces]